MAHVMEHPVIGDDLDLPVTLVARFEDEEEDEWDGDRQGRLGRGGRRVGGRKKTIGTRTTTTGTTTTTSGVTTRGGTTSDEA